MFMFCKKNLWRAISIIMMCVFFLFGFVMSIVLAANQNDSRMAFPVWLTGFVITISVTGSWGHRIEHSIVVERALEKIYRQSAGLPQENDAYTMPGFLANGINNLVNAASTTAQQPVQHGVPMQQPVQQVQNIPMQPMQSVPMQPAQPVQNIPMQQPVQSVPVQPVQPVQQVQPVQSVPVQPVPDANSDWFCSCGTQNSANAKFCKGCGKAR